MISPCVSFLPIHLLLAAILAGRILGQAEAGLPRESPDAPAVHEATRLALERDPTLTCNPFGVLVRYRAGTTEAQKRGHRARVGAGTFRRLDLLPDTELVGVGMDVPAAIARLTPFVERVEPDRVMRISSTPDDPSFWRLWGLKNYGGDGTAGIDAPAAWSAFTGDPNFVIAVLDTGIDYDHPDLAANIWRNTQEIPGNGVDDDGNGYVDDVSGWDFVGNDADPMDDHYQGHGTHVSGTIGAVGNNGIGVCGINWRCKIMALKVGSSSGGVLFSRVLLALDYAVGKGVRISNNSYASPGFSQLEHDAIAAAGARGHLFCAAAGNDSSDNDVSPRYPASYDLDCILSVGSMSSDNRMSYFSNYGASSVDLFAPGDPVYSTVPQIQGSYKFMSGTSMACPHVAGTAALAWAANPGLTRQQLRARILATVRPIPALRGLCATGGLVNASAALRGVPLPSAPALLAGQVVRVLMSYRVSLSWRDTSSNESGFLIVREHLDLPYERVVFSTGANVATYQDSPGPGNWRYRVLAWNAAGHSSFSSWTGVTVPRIRFGF